jgi:hypothetical protein
LQRGEFNAPAPDDESYKSVTQQGFSMDSELINIPDAIRVIAAALQEARFGLKLRTEQKSLFKNVKSCFLGINYNIKFGYF